MTDRRLMRRLALSALYVLAVGVVVPAARAQTLPTLDTDDSSLRQASVTSGHVHPYAQLGIGNGDLTRGSFDGDGTDLHRLPVQTMLGLGAEIAHAADGRPVLWLEAVTVNNFHSPHADEPASPRSWYDNNNLVGIIAEPAKGLRTALTYVVKTTPNGFGTTVHEANASIQYAGGGFIGMLKPGAVVTMHPHGGNGFYTQIGIAPEWHLHGPSGPTLSFPVKAGMGWSDFYGARTGEAAYGTFGVAFVQPVKLGSVKAALHAQAAAVVRAHAIARLGAGEAEHGTFAPLVSVGLSVAD